MHSLRTKKQAAGPFEHFQRGPRFGSTNLSTKMIRVAMMVAALSALPVVATLPALAQNETVLHSFGSQSGDGTYPGCCLVLDKQTNLYGTTNWGGAYGYGTVFKVTPNGETVLSSFGVTDLVPSPGGLTSDKQGSLYSATIGGGTYGYGTVFKLTPNGAVTVLHVFGSQSGDGIYPGWGLVLDKQSNLYGTTYYGGAYGYGTVFKLTPNGDETVLYSFGGQAQDAVSPSGGVIFDKRGNLYGTTGTGGAYGYGTVFKLTPTGDETVLYSFGGQAGDVNPGLHLVLDKEGNLYGTTGSGGTYNFGTVFKLTPTGDETVLYSFGGQAGDGNGPESRLIVDKQGNLYGSTVIGGTYNFGTVFKLTPTGVETVLHSFGQYGDGKGPIWDLVSDKQGNIYGTTSQGGAAGYGTVFKLMP
jgi:uncharacterized repeat protein (TIGR03803 family)